LWNGARSHHQRRKPRPPSPFYGPSCVSVTIFLSAYNSCCWRSRLRGQDKGAADECRSKHTEIQNCRMVAVKKTDVKLFRQGMPSGSAGEPTATRSILSTDASRNRLTATRRSSLTPVGQSVTASQRAPETSAELRGTDCRDTRRADPRLASGSAGEPISRPGIPRGSPPLRRG
jgi:hypothetical protein